MRKISASNFNWLVRKWQKTKNPPKNAKLTTFRAKFRFICISKNFFVEYLKMFQIKSATKKFKKNLCRLPGELGAAKKFKKIPLSPERSKANQQSRAAFSISDTQISKPGFSNRPTTDPRVKFQDRR